MTEFHTNKYLLSASLDEITKVPEILANFGNAVTEQLGKLVKGNVVSATDFTVPPNVEVEKHTTLANLLSTGIPVYPALFILDNPARYEKMNKGEKADPITQKEALEYILIETVMYAINGNSAMHTGEYKPRILKDVYQYDFSSDACKRILYGTNKTQFASQLYDQLMPVCFNGKLGSRLGLGIAGHRWVRAIAVANLTGVNSPIDAQAIGILRTLSKLGPYKALHPGNRGATFTNIFGNINKVAESLIVAYASDEVKNYLTQRKIIFKSPSASPEVSACSNWNIESIYDFLHGNNKEKYGYFSTKEITLGEFKKFVDQEISTCNDVKIVIGKTDRALPKILMKSNPVVSPSAEIISEQLEAFYGPKA